MNSGVRNAMLWFQASRPFSFTASITPVLIAAAWAWRSEFPVRWILFPLFLLCALLLHAATNLISDYVDYTKGVDREDTFGSSGVLVRNQLKPEAVRAGAYGVYGAALVIGLVIVSYRGWGLFVLGLLGMAGGFFYTVSPVGYKYHALGDIGVFLFMGVLLVAGAFWALTGVLPVSTILVSVPVSFLVAAILFANNVRDIKHDQDAGVRTLAGRLGFRRAKKLYYALLGAPYAAVLVLVATRIVSPWALAVFFSLPKALRNCADMRGGIEGKPETVATLDVQSAQLHLVFGLLFAAALAWGGPG